MFLNCHSWFSFHYGTLSIEQLLEEAQRHGVRKLVLTDINNTSGVLDFIRLAPKYGVEPVVGIEFRQGDDLRFIGIARNNEGFEELNRYLSECLLAGAREGKSSGNRDAIVPEKIPLFHNVAVVVPGFASPDSYRDDNHRDPLSTGRDRLYRHDNNVQRTTYNVPFDSAQGPVRLQRTTDNVPFDSAQGPVRRQPITDNRPFDSAQGPVRLQRTTDNVQRTTDPSTPLSTSWDRLDYNGQRTTHNGQPTTGRTYTTASLPKTLLVFPSRH